MKTMTYSEIKAIMVKHHDPSGSDHNRYMMKIRLQTNVTGNDTVFYKLDGCPPRGYGIFMQQRKTLILYTTRGEQFEKITDLDDVIDDAPAPVGLE